jgi:uncharacterized Zn finger protein (UPF0148 family)
MNQKNNTIECPNCGELLNVNELVYQQLKEEVQKESAEVRKALIEKVRAKALQESEQAMEALKASLKEKEAGLKQLQQAQHDIEKKRGQV